jgi:hypothetical protein
VPVCASTDAKRMAQLMSNPETLFFIYVS